MERRDNRGKGENDIVIVTYSLPLGIGVHLLKKNIHQLLNVLVREGAGNNYVRDTRGRQRLYSIWRGRGRERGEREVSDIVLT